MRNLHSPDAGERKMVTKILIAYASNHLDMRQNLFNLLLEEMINVGANGADQVIVRKAESLVKLFQAFFTFTPIDEGTRATLMYVGKNQFLQLFNNAYLSDFKYSWTECLSRLFILAQSPQYIQVRIRPCDNIKFPNSLS